MKEPTQISKSVLALALSIMAGLGAFAAPLAAQAEQPSQPTPLTREGGASNATTPPESNGKGIVVRLEMPWTVLLKRENITFCYILENRSDSSIPVAFPDGEPFGWPNGGQAFLEGKLRPGAPGPGPINSGLSWLKVEDATWPPLNTENEVVKGWGELPADQRVVWNSNRLRAREYFRIYSTEYLQAIQGHWLVGKGRWVSSKPVKVVVRDVPESQWTKVFEGEWSSYGRGLDSRTTQVMKIPIDTKWFLFSDFMCRICEVGEKDEFEFKLDPVIGQLEVTVKSPAGEKKHYYHMQHGLTRDIPWKAGPVSQYFPVPEPIPEAESSSPVGGGAATSPGDRPEAWSNGFLVQVIQKEGAWGGRGADGGVKYFPANLVAPLPGCVGWVRGSGGVATLDHRLRSWMPQASSVRDGDGGRGWFGCHDAWEVKGGGNGF